jgi:hypothetical protein
MQPFAITSDTELESAIRDKTSYSDTADEWPAEQAVGNIEDAKRRLFIKTGSDKWYTDIAYGQALVAMGALKAKEAVENINISSYGIADESLSFSSDDPDSSQQIRSWSGELNESLKQSEVDFVDEQDLQMRNTSGYIG